jgi:hypothetical protein
VKTTIEIPDDLLRRTKATAAMAGETLKEFVTAAIRERLQRSSKAVPTSTGWRAVFGLATREEVAEVDEVVARDLEQVDPSDWR